MANHVCKKCGSPITGHPGLVYCDRCTGVRASKPNPRKRRHHAAVRKCAQCGARISPNLDGTYEKICAECERKAILKKNPEHFEMAIFESELSDLKSFDLYADKFVPKFSDYNPNMNLDIFLNNSTMHVLSLSQITPPGGINIRQFKDLGSPCPVYLIAIRKNTSHIVELAVSILFLTAGIAALCHIIIHEGSATILTVCSIVLSVILALIGFLLLLRFWFNPHDVTWVKLMTSGLFYSWEKKFSQKEKNWIWRDGKREITMGRQNDIYYSITIENTLVAKDLNYVDACFLQKLFQWYFNTNDLLK